VILVGGGLVDRAGTLIVDPARIAYGARLSNSRVRPLAPLRRASLGNAAGLVGAAALATGAATLPELRAVRRAPSRQVTATAAPP
jgi:glucokinase